MQRLSRGCLVILSFVAACSSSSLPETSNAPASSPRESAMTSLPRAAKLWILNQAGDPRLEDFFQCMLGATDWNALATAYPSARPMSVGAHVKVTPNANGQYPCTARPGSASYFQCAVDTGRFNVAPGDVVLVVRPDGQVGGLDNAYASNPTNIAGGPNGGVMSVVNPITRARTSVVGAHVGKALSNPELLFVYAAHEAFEAQTDGISADCCDGETATGGPLPVCESCGPYQENGGYGRCGKYAAPGGGYGIDRITCPSGNTYEYQRVSPPGAHRYGSPEFNGTCNAIALTGSASNPCANVPAADNGEYCGTTTESGFDPTRASPSTLYDCQNGAVAGARACAAGCFIAPAGQADGCNLDPCAKVPSNANGAYCGGDDVSGFHGGDARTLYECANGTTSSMTACANGCVVEPAGQADRCR